MKILAASVLLLGLVRPAVAQNSIPVYPGAKLETEDEDACCAFVTTDPLAKVIGFYESKLGTKATTPTMQMPPGMQLRVLRVGQENLEIVSAHGMTRFALTTEQLSRDDARFAHQFRKAKKQMDPADTEYDEWISTHPLADATKFDLAVFPGARRDVDGYKAPDCYDVALYITEPFDKVLAFYQAKYGAALKKVDRSDDSFYYQYLDAHWSQDLGCTTVWEGRPGGGRTCRGKQVPLFYGTRGAVNREISLEETEEFVLVVPFFDHETRSLMTKVHATKVRISRQTLNDACVGIPADAMWEPYK